MRPPRPSRGPAQALEHPNRALLHDYVGAHPGASFRELLRGTGIPAGTARHHLMVLVRTDLLAERRHGASLRYFPSGAASDWLRQVLLRDPPLRRLHGWIAAHPGRMQRQVLDEAAQAWKWSRSTTQHRLGRLVEAGLVAVRHQGRRKLYSVVEPASPPHLLRRLEAALAAAEA